VRFVSSILSRQDLIIQICLVVYSMAQASKAIIPKDPGGPSGKRIGVSVGGSSGWALRVGAYVTYRVSSDEWLRYALVVLNCKSTLSPRRRRKNPESLIRGRRRFNELETSTSDNHYRVSWPPGDYPYLFIYLQLMMLSTGHVYFSSGCHHSLVVRAWVSQYPKKHWDKFFELDIGVVAFVEFRQIRL